MSTSPDALATITFGHHFDVAFLYAPKTLRELSRNEEISPELAKIFWQQLMAGDEPNLSYEHEILMIGSTSEPYSMASLPVVKGLLLYIQENNQMNTEKIKGFQLNGVFFDESTWKSFIQGVDNIAEIEALHFIGCGLEGPQINFLSFYAPKLISRLIGLSIDQNDITMSMAEEIKNFICRCPWLTGFSLSDCGMGDTIFQTILEGFKDHRAIHELDLSNNHLGDASALKIGLILKDLLMLKCLTLRDNNISDLGLKFLSPFLEESNLRSLDMGANRVTGVGAQRLLEDSKGITKLSLANNANINTLSFLRTALKVPRLKTLDLSHIGISDDAVRDLAAKKIVKAQRNHDNKMNVVLCPDDSTLTIDGVVAFQALFSEDARVLLLTKRKKERQASPPIRHPALDEPLYNEIMAALQATMDFLARIKTIKNEDDEMQEIIQEACFKALLDKQFDIIPIPGDGNCLFASMVECLGHKKLADYHAESCKDHMTPLEFRSIVIDHIKKNWEEYAPYVQFNGSESIPTPMLKVLLYCQMMADPKEWAQEVEVQAILAVMNEMGLKRPIWIYDRISNNTIIDGKIQIPPHMVRGYPDSTEEPVLLYRLNDNHYSAMFPKEGHNKRQTAEIVEEISEAKRVKKEEPKEPKEGAPS